jgi:hypothetical protein
MTTYVGTQKGRAPLNSTGQVGPWADSNAVAVTAALTTSDAIVAMDVPAGVRLETLRFRSGDMDTGTGTLTMNIGYRTKLPGGSQSSATFFASASAAFAAATTTWQELVFAPVKFDEPVEIVLVPAVAANALGATATAYFQATGVLEGIS